MQKRSNMDTLKKMISKISDTVCVSAYFFICCLPVVTAGAAMSGLYYAVNKSVYNNRGYVSKEFFRGFKEGFKNATLGWLLELFALAFFAMDFYLVSLWQVIGIRIAFMVFFVLLMLAIISWGIYFRAYVARFDDTWKTCLLNSGRLALAGFYKTICLVLLFVACMIACIYFLPAVLFLPGIYGAVAVKVIEKSFRKIMSAEDIALEDERNRVW